MGFNSPETQPKATTPGTLSVVLAGRPILAQAVSRTAQAARPNFDIVMYGPESKTFYKTWSLGDLEKILRDKIVVIFSRGTIKLPLTTLK